MNEVAKNFAKILKAKKELEKLSLNYEKGDDKFKRNFHAIEDKFKLMLREFLYSDFTSLSKEKFLPLCDLVSTHRPVEPFSFLVSISIRKGK